MPQMTESEDRPLPEQLEERVRKGMVNGTKIDSIITQKAAYVTLKLV